MKKCHVTVNVTNGKLTGIEPRRAYADPGDRIVWAFRGSRKGLWIGIGGFRDLETGSAKNPMTEPGYWIGPSDSDDKPGDVKATDDAKGLYRYRIVSIPATSMDALASEMAKQCASPVQPDFVLRVMTGCDGDSELDPEVQVGGSGG